MNGKDRQYAHLMRVGQQALADRGLLETRLTFVSDTENVIFRVETAQSTYVLRIYPKQSRPDVEIEGELYWLDDLHRQTDLIVPHPLSWPNDRLVWTTTDRSTGAAHQMVLFPWLEGEVVGTNSTPQIVRQLGGAMAQLHTHAQLFSLPAGIFREADDWRPMGTLSGPLNQQQISRLKGYLAAEDWAICEAAAERVAHTIANLSVGEAYGLVHADLHFGNCLWHEGRLKVIDFDDCQFAPFAYDLGITQTYLETMPNYNVNRGAFIEGYSAYRPWPAHHEAEIEAFVVERCIRLLRWVATWPTVDHFQFGRATLEGSVYRCRRYLKKSLF